MIHHKNFQHINIDFQTLMAPPPYSNHYHFLLKPQDNKLQLNYQLTYTERETLTEEEILEEGFTPDDDYTWKGSLPAVWLQALEEMLVKTNKLKPSLPKDQPNLIRLQLTDAENKKQEGIPDNLEGWEYFLQEMTQAVFEISQKEQTLVIHYREVSKDGQILDVSFKPSFSKRNLQIETQQVGKKQRKTAIWKQLKPLLKAIYLPDYDHTHAAPVPPTHPGQYIDPGEGIWYDLKKDLSNPGKHYDAISALEKEIKKLIEIEKLGN